MTGRPGVCLAVSGPGVVHALAGLGNAWANCWPMVLLGGASATEDNELGGFQVWASSLLACANISPLRTGSASD